MYEKMDDNDEDKDEYRIRRIKRRMRVRVSSKSNMSSSPILFYRLLTHHLIVFLREESFHSNHNQIKLSNNKLTTQPCPRLLKR